MNTLDFIRATLHDRFDVPTESITPDAILETMGVDSLGLIELLFDIEDKTGFRPAEDFPAPKTVADLLAIVDKSLNAQPELMAPREVAA
ncbi:MAG: acyl carrier protein [Gallionellaceae bacterium]|nr:acyl carrier protein [Gallionellaceae bacterium]MDD5365986.1 acyl carrier protein [Gallionellaceae bacterium]